MTRTWIGISTSTLGGAVATALVSSLLGSSAPWFVERVSAGRRHKVEFGVNAIFDANLRADRASSYVDDELRFRIDKPPADWKVSRTTPGHLLDGLSIAYVPFFRMSVAMFKAFGGAEKRMLEFVTTTDVTPSTAPVKVEFLRESRIGSVPLTLNPADDMEFVRATYRASAQLFGFGEKPLDEPTLLQVQQRMKEEYGLAIEKNWPAAIDFTPGITITVYRLPIFRTNPLFNVIVRDESPSLVLLLSFVTMSNAELFSANIRTLSVSTNNDAMLLDSSLLLNKLKIGGEVVESAELTRYALIARQKDLVYIVTVRDLFGRTGPRADADELIKIFKSFRVQPP